MTAIDLSVPIAGVTLKNPIIAASCELTMDEAGIRACIDAGAGAVIAKSVNERPEAAAQLNVADYVFLEEHDPIAWDRARIGSTLFNRSGLAQDHLDEWVAMLKRAGRYADSRGCLLAGSITAASIDGTAQVASSLSGAVRALEVNVGAPHGREAEGVVQMTEADAVGALTAQSRVAFTGLLIIKLPAQASDIVAMAKAAERAGADAVCIMGRHNGFVPDLESGDAVLRSWGAIGGRWALPISMYWASKTYLSVDMPVIGTNGVRTGLDAARFMLAGASAVELASLPLMKGPRALSAIVTDLERYLDGCGLTARDLIGMSAKRARPYSALQPVVPPRRPWQIDRSSDA